MTDACADVLLGFYFEDDAFVGARMSISKAVRYAIILGAAIVKVPIILNMIGARSGGISMIALTLGQLYMSTFIYCKHQQAFQHVR